MTAPSPAPLGTDAETPEPRRRFLLARLAMAVRRQDWFTVLVEITIVVLGVVIGFQVTAWGQAQSDRAKEQVYLRQLAADLRETEREVRSADAFFGTRDRYAAQLLHTYYLPERPPEDSLRTWFRGAYRSGSVFPVVGTAEALVATGDLALIRDDSLRTAITAYLQQMDRSVRSQGEYTERFSLATGALYSALDPLAVIQALEPPAVLDSLARADPLFWLPPGPRREPEEVSVAALLDTPGTRARLWEMNLTKLNVRRIRARIAEDTADLLARVETEITP